LETINQFNKNAEKIAFDLDHRKKINFNIDKYNQAIRIGKNKYVDLEKAKERAAHIKYKVLNDLDKYLIQFEDSFEKRGGKVIWAQDKKEAIKQILSIVKKKSSQRIVKSKSMTTEEIDLNQFLEKKKVEVTETDLGEFIVQLAGEKPYHIVTPAMHKSKEDIAELFHNKLKMPAESSPEDLTSEVRDILREKFQKADIGITGANFLIADQGAIALTENEGNGVLTMSFPKTHIIVVGIEKIIPSIHDLDLFWPLLSFYGTGQSVTVYNSIVNGPKQKNEVDGPDEMYVILLDNKRSYLLAEERQRRALSCIRCGACLNVCPVYKNIGGYTYNTIYSGPIGSVINPYLLGMQDYKHQSFASSLCGKCTEICPVKIPLHDLLLINRNESVIKGYATQKEKISVYIWKKLMNSRKKMDIMSMGNKNLMIKYFFKKSWGQRRVLPKVAEKSFNKLWKEKHDLE
jgi:L-lactate dehydrogenase complex protein LldF